jgi:hypothetical protein
VALQDGRRQVPDSYAHARAAAFCNDLLAEIEGYDPDLGPGHPRGE